jgi:hypothetical protein
VHRILRVLHFRGWGGCERVWRNHEKCRGVDVAMAKA